jgi:hypothetical protein
MIYKFIGTNGSMGLLTGNRYEVHVEPEDEKIYANVFLSSTSIKVGRQDYAGKAPDIPFMPYIFIPYDDKAHFDKNWVELDDCRCTNRGKDDGQTTCWLHHDCSDGSCTHQDE